VWLVLFGGAILTIGFTFFFKTENLRAQALEAVLEAFGEGPASHSVAR
jgi:hypothetical protein